MSELQIGLLAIGAVVVAGVLIYNRVQEGRARRDAERNFRSGHEDVLIGHPVSSHGSDMASAHPAKVLQEAPRHAHRAAVADHAAQPDPAIDYIIEFSAEQPVGQGALREQWVDENQDGVFDYKILIDPFGARSERIPIHSTK